jgi:hypothetical protein
MDLNKTHTDILEARAEMLQQAEERFSARKVRETADSSSKSAKKSKKHKKEKKSKKSKTHKKSKKKHYSSDEQTSSDSERDEWVEKELMPAVAAENKPTTREDWMTAGLLIKTYNKSDLKIDKPDVKKEDKLSIDSYDPAKSTRELNPYWKDGGTGLPTFQRPAEDSDDEKPSRYKSTTTSKQSGNWRKTEHRQNSRINKSRSRSRSRERRRRSRSASNDEIESSKLQKKDNILVQAAENVSINCFSVLFIIF